MAVFHSASFDDHEDVIFARDARTGLKAIIAIHSTSLGPALGGCRMYPYRTEGDAVEDVLRLSRGMSYKAAIANVALGGGKSVIIGDPRRDKSEAILEAFGRAMARLGGRYIVGEDIGTKPDDMRVIRRQTNAVSCLRKEDGGYGDPAPLTALGVLQAIRAGLSVCYGTDDLTGIRVAVQGVGNVGWNLCSMLAAAGAKLTVADTDAASAARAGEFGATIVQTDTIHAVDAHVFAPCATGAILNDSTIPQLKARVVAGAANNQLAESRHANALRERGIVYVPDYVANAGGLISCAAEWYRTDFSEVRSKVLAIHATCLEIFERAASDGSTPSAAADVLARARMHAAAN